MTAEEEKGEKDENATRRRLWVFLANIKWVPNGEREREKERERDLRVLAEGPPKLKAAQETKNI